MRYVVAAGVKRCRGCGRHYTLAELAELDQADATTLTNYEAGRDVAICGCGMHLEWDQHESQPYIDWHDYRDIHPDGQRRPIGIPETELEWLWVRLDVVVGRAVRTIDGALSWVREQRERVAGLWK